MSPLRIKFLYGFGLACLLAISGCRHADSSYQLINLPDGKILNPGGLDDSLRGWKVVDLHMVSFVGKSLDRISINASAGGSVQDEELGATTDCGIISIPGASQTPFYIVVSWSDAEYKEAYVSKDWGPRVANHIIRKQRLVHVRGPLPPDPEAMLLIFYPNDRVECEIVGSKPGVTARINELQRREGVR